MLCSGCRRPSRPHSENQRKRKEKKVLGPYQRTKIAMEHESDGDANCKWRTWNSSEKLGKEAGRVRNQWTNRDNPNYSIDEFGQNTEKSPGDLRRLAIV